MGTPKSSDDSSSNRQKWNKIFNALVHMLKTQQTQLQSLAKERKILEERISLQYHRWVDDVNIFQDQIYQMKKELTIQETECVVEAAKSDLIMGLKQREAFIYKRKLENADSELEDFRAWFDLLSHPSKIRDTPSIVTKEGMEQHCKALESELRELKSQNEKLSSENSPHGTALLSETKFVWNQHNIMTYQLNSKHAEIEQANEKIRELLAFMEQLQSSNTEKDSMIVTLRASVAKIESDCKNKSEEILQLSRELEPRKKSSSGIMTPVLRSCTEETGKSGKGATDGSLDGKVTNAKKRSYSLQVLEKDKRASKRKPLDIVPPADTPKLFSSTFTFPKLKHPSHAV